MREIAVQGGQFYSYSDFKTLTGTMPSEASSEMLGILLMRKGQEIADKGIVPSLSYFDARSGEHIHFILAGWRRDQIAPGPLVWSYDDSAFVRACQVISEQTTWLYSGGVDLLLVTANRRPNGGFIVDFKNVIYLPLHTLKERKLIESPEVLFERIFRFAQHYKGPNPLAAFSAQEARVSLVQAVIESVLGWLPREAKENFDYAKNFVVRDVSKSSPSNAALVQQVSWAGPPFV
ncbi:hypothetical protein SAMN02745157_1621 [Kaistia soli DSM 19436]|uniref:Uncharacterized protein n=1 Tax=Kaistia soli DSM 19436 TaxID=1122133 RepID=A0A1M4YUG2_9HYPH|nr:hypothetical protein [Kaistia soli]SHF09358.1 hypothetical protein SAMN02745157_1621 [Kaistia soli DSM 19436]